ncbi:reverse transcriptase domain-containing protein [Tanacetum coccineum]
MKRLVISLSSLTPPFPKETLYAYLAVAKEVVSAVLLTDRNGRQCPVQYVSRTLNDAENNYSPLEKLAISLVNMTRRLEAASLKGSGAGLVLIGPSGLEYTYALRHVQHLSSTTEAVYELPRRVTHCKKNEGVRHRGEVVRSTVQERILGPDVEVCVGPLQANYVIREIHMGSCGMHIGPRAVVRKAMRQGYYWPTMHADAKEEVWPSKDNNGAQLVNEPFKGWCTRFKIQQMNTSVAHPQANGLVERANRSLMEGIKTRLGRERAGWVDELPNVLWAHRTSIKQSNGETPFSLTYGSEAVIPAEIGIPSYRTLMIREEYNEEEQRLNLDLLQERREAAAIREAKYKTKMEQYYNKRVRPAGFGMRICAIEGMKARRLEDKESCDHIGKVPI